MSSNPLQNVTFAHRCILFASKDAFMPIHFAHVNTAWHEAVVRYLAAFQVWSKIIKRCCSQEDMASSSISGFEKMITAATSSNSSQTEILTSASSSSSKSKKTSVLVKSKIGDCRIRGLLLGGCRTLSSLWIVQQLIFADLPLSKHDRLVSNFMVTAAAHGNDTILKMLLLSSSTSSSSSSFVFTCSSEQFNSEFSAKIAKNQLLFKLLCYDAPVSALSSAFANLKKSLDAAVFLFFDVFFRDFIESYVAVQSVKQLLVSFDENFCSPSRKERIMQKAVFWQRTYRQVDKYFFDICSCSDADEELITSFTNKRADHHHDQQHIENGLMKHYSTCLLEAKKLLQKRCEATLRATCANPRQSHLAMSHSSFVQFDWIDSIFDRKSLDEESLILFLKRIFKLMKDTYLTRNSNNNNREETKQINDDDEEDDTTRYYYYQQQFFADDPSQPGKIFLDTFIAKLLRKSIIRSKRKVVEFLLTNDELFFSNEPIDPFTQGIAIRLTSTTSITFSDDYCQALQFCSSCHHGSGPTTVDMWSSHTHEPFCVPIFQYVMMATERGDLDILRMLVKKGLEIVDDDDEKPRPEIVEKRKSKLRKVIKNCVIGSAVFQRFEMLQFWMKEFPDSLINDSKKQSSSTQKKLLLEIYKETFCGLFVNSNNNNDDDKKQKLGLSLSQTKVWHPDRSHRFHTSIMLPNQPRAKQVVLEESGDAVFVCGKSIENILILILEANVKELRANGDMVSEVQFGDEEIGKNEQDNDEKKRSCGGGLSCFIEDSIPDVLKIMRFFVQELGVDPNATPEETLASSSSSISCFDCTADDSEISDYLSYQLSERVFEPSALITPYRTNNNDAVQNKKEPIIAGDALVRKVGSVPLLHTAVKNRASLPVIRFLVEVLGCDPRKEHVHKPISVYAKEQKRRAIFYANDELEMLRQRKTTEEYRKCLAVRDYLSRFED